LNQEINRAIRQPEVSEKLVNAGLIVVNESPEYFAEILKSDYKKYGDLVRAIGFKPQ
jgi:tripartite-type tricarboxylate transporter receptor subunit TctC